MRKIKSYPPVKYFAAITYTPDFSLTPLVRLLEKEFSSVEKHSQNFNFSQFTDYYSSEMGTNLFKEIITFKDLKPADLLPKIKIATNEMEVHFLRELNRQVNIDPGYLCAAKVVLATTKDYDHRLYLGDGVFGDVHLRFQKGNFNTREWTYPDYRQPMILDFFKEIRELYLSQLQNWS
jgi:hypothetical protein